MLFSHLVVSDSFVAPWTIACQAPPSMGFPRQEYWSGLPFPSPGDFPNPGIKTTSAPWQTDSLPLSHLGSPWLLFLMKWFLLSDAFSFELELRPSNLKDPSNCNILHLTKSMTCCLSWNFRHWKWIIAICILLWYLAKVSYFLLKLVCPICFSANLSSELWKFLKISCITAVSS